MEYIPLNPKEAFEITKYLLGFNVLLVLLAGWNIWRESKRAKRR
jgi:hypothetical protein